MHRHTCLRSCMVAHHQPVCMTQASFEKCAINDLHVVETRSTPQLRVGWCSLSPTPHRATTTDDLMTRPLRSGPSICFIISCFSRLRQIAPARFICPRPPIFVLYQCMLPANHAFCCALFKSILDVVSNIVSILESISLFMGHILFLSASVSTPSKFGTGQLCLRDVWVS
eukprot:scaffold271397_cov19-Tisochrysis_lutea.AAC.2